VDSEVTRGFFTQLFADLPTFGPGEIPLLAHYTNTSVLESILRNEEFWLSNPLYMNDFQEVRFGITEGQDRVVSSIELRDAFKDTRTYDQFLSAFDYLYRKFADVQVIDLYVLCFSALDKNDTDGKLSMWRAYGADASGACIVLNPENIPPVTEGPFVFSRVEYASNTEQLERLDQIIANFCGILRTAEQDHSSVFEYAYYLFERIKIFAVFSKHRGFIEENEWRLVYLTDRDEKKTYSPMIDYVIGPRGLEPKLKIRLNELPEFSPGTLSLKNIVDRIILGPTVSHPLGKAMVEKMLDKLDKGYLKPRVYGSTVPYRAVPAWVKTFP
jgi:hypothetical protein